MKRFTSDNAHWYTREGVARHRVIGANGAERATDLRDARKQLLLPSVTSILGVVNKAAVVEWKQKQAIEAALTLPRLPGETEDAFADRAVADALEHASAAAEFGTKVHAAVALVMAGAGSGWAAEVEPWIPVLRTWVRENVVRLHWSERVLVNLAGGYAGTADALIEHKRFGEVLVDFKTQGIRDGAEAAFYDEWVLQLAAYRAALHPVGCLSVVIGSKSPRPLAERLWNSAELSEALPAFEAAAVLWRFFKGFDPRTGGAA